MSRDGNGDALWRPPGREESIDAHRNRLEAELAKLKTELVNERKSFYKIRGSLSDIASRIQAFRDDPDDDRELTQNAVFDWLKESPDDLHRRVAAKVLEEAADAYEDMASSAPVTLTLKGVATLLRARATRIRGEST